MNMTQDIHSEFNNRNGHEINDYDLASIKNMMAMSFHFGTKETVLFSFWKFTNITGLLGSSLGIFLLAVLYEALKYYREYLFWSTYRIMRYRSDSQFLDGTLFSKEIQVSQPYFLSTVHILQTVLHVLQIVLSYFLMLIFMTYNVWLGIAIVIGSTTGYFLFGWKKSMVVDVTDHCH